MKSIKQIIRDYLRSRHDTPVDHLIFVKRCLSPMAPDWERDLVITPEYAHQGGISRVLFALNGSPMKGHAVLYPDSGSLNFIPGQPERFALHVHRHLARSTKQIFDATVIELFLAVAKEQVPERRADSL